MHQWARFVWLATLAGLSFHSLAQEPEKPSLEPRVPWTTSRISGSPESPLPYTTERAFPALQFKDCLDLAALPGSDRLFVVEQAGKIFSFPNREDVERADLVVDLANQLPGVKQVYALAFHPDFARNRFCYLCYILDPDLPNGTHVARFRVSESDPPTLDVASERTIITWLSGGHNGCCLKFGPDGCLYISTGDGTGPNPPDNLRAGQDLSNLLSAILRIDVDHTEGDRNYRIPPDNPFVDLPGARGEIWAYGLRNPWRMSFDRRSGDLWVGDVGWEMWELLYRVERGGNYGWAVMEGRQAINPEWPRGPTPILPPTIDHSHTESSSITDGLTYYGNRIPELNGMHIYSDYDTGKFWGFRFENGQVVGHRELADTTHRVVGFGEDHHGELLLLDHTAGTIHRMAPNPRRDRSASFPRKLGETGLFASVRELTPAPGVLPYAISAEPWSDHAVMERWVAVPGESEIQNDEAAWKFPLDSVLVKTLSLDMRQGDPSSRRSVETQILHYDGLDWQTYTYEWLDDQSDAVLVEATGKERTIEIDDSSAPGGRREQAWRFAGRAECQRCHNKWSGPVLAFNTPQLNRPLESEGSSRSQLDGFTQIGLLKNAVPADKRPRLADPRDPSADCDARARAYLHVNCAHCHRLHAGGAVLSQMPFDVPLNQCKMLGVRPTQGTFGIHSAEVVAPREPFRSILLYRMSKLGGGRMPHIGSTEVDRAGVRLLYEWIASLSPPAAASEGDGPAAKVQQLETERMDRLHAVSSTSEQSALVHQLLTSTSGALRLLHAVDRGDLPEPVASLAVATAIQHQEPAVRDLFERFVPPEQRIKRLGSAIDPDQILSLPSDVEAGRRVFFEMAGVACQNCHRIGQQGKEVGPELSVIGKNLNRMQLLESILQPSKRIDPKYVTYLAETEDGRLLTGLMVQQSPDEVVLKDAQDQIHRIPRGTIEQLAPQQQSLMPELLLRDMTAQQAADLLAFLASLK